MQNNPYGIMVIWQQGDAVIFAVALLLLLMSIATWTIIIIRSYRLWRLRKQVGASNVFWHTRSFSEGLHVLGMNDLGKNDPGHPFRYLAEQGQAALAHHQTHQYDLHGHLPLSEWVTDSLSSAIDEAAERLQRGLTVLASVAATAPFIGLFGTVWGIYHALVSIGVSGQASIDKVAGPVGEALIMTAFGLAVAIPAVLGYNALVRANKSVLGKLKRFAHQLHAYFMTGIPVTSASLKSFENRCQPKSSVQVLRTGEA